MASEERDLYDVARRYEAISGLVRVWESTNAGDSTRAEIGAEFVDAMVRDWGQNGYPWHHEPVEGGSAHLEQALESGQKLQAHYAAMDCTWAPADYRLGLIFIWRLVGYPHQQPTKPVRLARARLAGLLACSDDKAGAIITFWAQHGVLHKDHEPEHEYDQDGHVVHTWNHIVVLPRAVPGPMPRVSAPEPEPEPEQEHTELVEVCPGCGHTDMVPEERLRCGSCGYSFPKSRVKTVRRPRLRVVRPEQATVTDVTEEPTMVSQEPPAATTVAVERAVSSGGVGVPTAGAAQRTRYRPVRAEEARPTFDCRCGANQWDTLGRQHWYCPVCGEVALIELQPGASAPGLLHGSGP